MRFLILICLIVLPSFAMAEVASELPELKYESKVSQQEFILKTQRIEETPGKDKLLSLRVRLPSDWVKTQEKPDRSLELGNRLLGEVVKYVSPPIGDVRASFIVLAVEMEYLISPKNWLLNYLVTRGYTPRGFKEVNSDRLEVEYVMLREGLTYIVRSVIQRNGNRIVMAEFMLPSTAGQITREIQIWSMRTFRLLNKDKSPPVELKHYKLLDMGGFYYPTGWVASTIGEKTPDNITVQLSKKKVFENERDRPDYLINEQDGVISSYYLSRNTFPNMDNAQAYFDKILSDKNMSRGELIETRASNDARKIPEINRYRLTLNEGKFVNYEYWYALHDVGTHIYVTTLITPAKEVEFLNWARNNATFELVASSFRSEQ